MLRRNLATTMASRRGPGRRGLATALSLALLASLAAACGGQQQAASGGGPCDKSESYPRGPVQLVVPWAAGGGTDSVARFLGT
ncbi:MAG: hypothetical protein ACRDPT_17185 [Streptomycetales bacterium]